MANRQKLVHMHSNVKNKKPLPSALEFGELAVNYNKGYEFISTKNEDNEVVKFSSDPQLITWIEKKEVIPYSGVVESVNLVNNTSSLGIKFNQVAASATPMSNIINSSTSTSASFSIDMAKYAMIGANPSFSSVTATNALVSNGTTTLNGNTTVNSNNVTVAQSNANGSLNISEKTTSLSGTSLDVKEVGTVTIASSGNTSINSASGNVTVTSSGMELTSSEGIDIDATKTICLDASQAAYVYGLTTNVGKNCNNSVATTTNINGSVTNIAANTLNVSGLTTVKGSTTIDGSLKVASGATFSGDTAFKGKVTFDSPIKLGNKLSWNHGKYTTYTEGNTYDGTSARTITFPSQVNELNDWDAANEQLNIQGQLYVSGPLTCQTAIYSSDIALKENIEDADIFKKIAANKVNVKSFNFKNDETKAKVYGILAQEVEAQGLGEIVFTKDDGYKAVDYTSLMMLKISFLENENRLMRYELSKLNEKIEKLENK